MNQPARALPPLTPQASLQVLPPAEGLAQEMALLSAVTRGELRAGFLIWRCQRALVVPQRLARQPLFDQAARRMHQAGWPVQVRGTGGDLTPQAPGLINVALAFRRRRDKSAIRDSYMTLCQPLIDQLADQGINARCASVPGAFCDGDYNLVVDGRKLAGTAQRWRRMQPEAGADEAEFGVLAHAVLLCDEPLDPLWQAANRFYRYCGLPPHVQPQRHIALAELQPTRSKNLLALTVAQLEARLSACLSTL